MIGRWLRGVLGTSELVGELRAEREAQRQLMAQVVKTSEVQAEAMKSVVGVIEAIYKSYQTTEIPEERHLSEEQEDAIIHRAWYGSDESN